MTELRFEANKGSAALIVTVISGIIALTALPTAHSQQIEKPAKPLRISVGTSLLYGVPALTEISYDIRQVGSGALALYANNAANGVFQTSVNNDTQSYGIEIRSGGSGPFYVGAGLGFSHEHYAEYEYPPYNGTFEPQIKMDESTTRAGYKIFFGLQERGFRARAGVPLFGEVSVGFRSDELIPGLNFSLGVRL